MKIIPLKTLLSLPIPILAIALPVHSALLEEVVVTAQKRSQSLQEVGISVTAYTGDQLKQLGYDNAQQITAQTPGVNTIQPNGPSSYYISIRGVSQNDFSGDHQESPVAVYIDEAYISAASGAGFQLFDMERVEILRGPQGTLFGRNATGGLAHYITKKPSDTFEGYVDLTYGDYDQRKIEAAVGGPITDGVNGRLSFTRNLNDAYIDNRIGKDLNNGDDYAVRGQLQFDFNEKVTWLISGRYGWQSIDTGLYDHSSARLNPVTGLGEDFNGTDLQGTGDSLATPYQDTDSNNFAGEYNTIGYNKLKTFGFTSNLSWTFENFDLVLITDYFDLHKDYIEDSDSSPNDFFAFYLQSDLDQFSQEIRFSGDYHGVRWVGGAYYLKIDGDFVNGGTAGNFFAAGNPGFGLEGSNIGLFNPFDSTTEAYSLFGQVEYDFTDKLTLIGGLRWTNEEKQFDFVQYVAEFENPSSNTVVGTDFLGLGGPVFTYNEREVTNDPGGPGFGFPLVEGNPGAADAEEDLYSVRLQLNYNHNDNTLLYASYNRGVKGGGFNAPLDATSLYDGDPSNGTPDNMSFGDETLNAYELGFKLTLFDGLARLNGAAYYYDYEDYQAFNLEGLTLFVFNADAEVYGAELELQASPMRGLDVALGISYTDSTVEDAYNLPSGKSVDRTAVMTPEWTANGLIRYEWEMLGGTLAVQSDFNYMDDHYFQLKNSPVGKEGSYTLFNARVSYTSADEHWSLTAFVDNLTDKDHRTMVFDLAGPASAGGFGMAENYYATPRWWGLTAGYQW